MRRKRRRSSIPWRPNARRCAAKDAALPAQPAVRLTRDFNVFGQHWDLTFDYAAPAVASLRSSSPWVWLLAGLSLTAVLVLYLWRETGRTRAIEALVHARTAELQHTSEQLHQAQKMEAIGNLTGGMAHDFNNLLSVVIGNLDLLQDRVKSDPEAMALSESALQASMRGAELTRRLLAFARRQPLRPAWWTSTSWSPACPVAGAHPRREHRGGAQHRPGCLAGPDRSRAAERGHRQSCHQCPRRHAEGRPADDRDQERASRRRLCRAQSGGRRRRLCAAGGVRHRHRHVAGDAEPGVRAILHDQGGRPAAPALASAWCSAS